MRVLALDTTTRVGSVAVVQDDRVLVERAGDPSRSHAERLPGDLLRALEEARATIAEVDAFAIVAGPGSFTGLRIGIAAVQGLAFVEKKPVVAVSALEALAQSAAARCAPGVRVGAWVDAFRHEVYGALYRVAGGEPYAPERVNEIDAPAVADPSALAARWRDAGGVDLYTGDGADAYAALVREHAAIVPAPLLAGVAGLMAAVRAARGQGVHPSAVHPIYIRRPDAEVARERAASLR
jgi:tRNA threonylcarbamoyladenosine biosynthesis protein TsaB